MSLISSALFAISASLDALLLGLVLGIRRIHISLIQNLCISFITLLGSFLAIRLGNLIPLITEASLFAPGFITSVGCGILLGIGLYYVIKALFTAFLDDKMPSTDKKDTTADLFCGLLLIMLGIWRLLL